VAAVSGIFSTPQVQTVPFSRSYRLYVRYGWLVCSAVLMMAVIAMRWVLWYHHAFPGDAWAARLGTSHKAWLVYAITRVYQQVGRPLVAIGEVLVMLGWLWRTGGRRTAQGLLLALLASAVCGLIKTICGPTPVWLALHHVGSNFPSGVVTFVTAAGGYVAAVARRQGRVVVPAAALLMIAGAGPARVLGGQHLLSDALGGYMLGAAWLIVAVIYMVRPSRAPEKAGDPHELFLSTA
jgi:undecaprenyl-diphosphatase